MVEAPVKRTEPRDYIVLGKTMDGTWKEIGKQSAVTDKKAIEPFALKQMVSEANTQTSAVERVSSGPQETKKYTEFVAVAARSWNPRQPKAKTEPRLSW